LKPTVFEASNIGVNSSTAGAKTYTIGDDLRSGRSPIDHFDAKIIACLERESFSSAHSLAKALDVSPATVLSHLHNSPAIKNFHLRWVPYQLTDDLRQVRVGKCGEVLCALEAMPRTHFRHIITGDESSSYFQYEHASQWSISRDEVPQWVEPTIGTTKFMPTTIWGVNGFHLPDLIPSHCRFNAQYFVEHVMALWFGRSSHKGGLDILLDSMFISTTAVFTSQK
jgi:hypothetical protein